MLVIKLRATKKQLLGEFSVSPWHCNCHNHFSTSPSCWLHFYLSDNILDNILNKMVKMKEIQVCCGSNQQAGQNPQLFSPLCSDRKDTTRRFLPCFETRWSYLSKLCFISDRLHLYSEKSFRSIKISEEITENLNSFQISPIFACSSPFCLISYRLHSI